jgi:hypothetical protein
MTNEQRRTNDEMDLVANLHSFGFSLSFVISYFSSGHLGQHVGGAARVINNAVRLEQGRNHHNALCSGVDHAL